MKNKIYNYLVNNNINIEQDVFEYFLIHLLNKSYLLFFISLLEKI